MIKKQEGRMEHWGGVSFCGFGKSINMREGEDMKTGRISRAGVILVLLFSIISIPCVASAEGDQKSVNVGGIQIYVDGFLREYISLNLQDPKETTINDSWAISMARTSAEMTARTTVSDVRLKTIGRIDAEMETDYLRRLEAAGAASGDLMGKYNKSELREATAEFDVGDRTTVTLGKQQIVWGETDFFQAMDMVHGYDYTWRSFLEGENEEWRKPLVLASVKYQVPEANGSLQVFLRPGFDSDKNIGNTYDLYGGRWASQPNKGINFLAFLPYNYHHKDGDADRPTWGARWSGVVGTENKVGYSLAYMNTLGPDPVVNPVDNPYHSSAVAGVLGEFFYPKVDVFGATANYYSSLLDSVFAFEVAYTKGKYYNYGTGSITGIPGWGGVTRKDTVRGMLRFDRTVDTTFFTSRPSDFSIQLFDTYIPSFDKKDDIKDTAGYGGAKKEHSAIATVFLGMHLKNDRINPTIAGGYDLTYGGGFVIPSVEFVPDDKWRLKVEADIWLPKDQKSPGQVEDSTHLLGYFANNSQLFFRLTRLF